LKIAWKHPAEGFYQLYKQQVNARMAKRWQALWVLRRGERLKPVKEVGISRKPIQRGVRAWKGARVKCVVWDHAAFHKGKAMEEGGLRQVYQPPYSPES
jgi:hypothetical protein